MNRQIETIKHKKIGQNCTNYHQVVVKANRPHGTGYQKFYSTVRNIKFDKLADYLETTNDKIIKIVTHIYE